MGRIEGKGACGKSIRSIYCIIAAHKKPNIHTHIQQKTVANNTDDKDYGEAVRNARYMCIFHLSVCIRTHCMGTQQIHTKVPTHCTLHLPLLHVHTLQDAPLLCLHSIMRAIRICTKFRRRENEKMHFSRTRTIDCELLSNDFPVYRPKANAPICLYFIHAAIDRTSFDITAAAILAANCSISS